jgi:hypothetical protein
MIARWRAELAAFATLLVVYIVTLAPGVTFWDSGEFLAAMHSLGIPHPPGTPLYVLIGNIWGSALAPILGFAYSVNLLSAVCTAGACALMANLFVRWTGDHLAAYAGAVTAGAMSSVWMSATETEVYAPALFLGCLILWNCDRADNPRRLVLAAFLAGLGFALHLTALLTIPAALYLAISRRGFRQVTRSVPSMLALFVLGASVILFMLLRAPHDPFVNQGNPSTLSALWDVMMRKQYAPAPLWPRQAPVFIQIGNLFEYADWQFALSLAPDPPPTFFRTSVSVLFGILGVVGCVYHRRHDRRSWNAMMILFGIATLGVIAYLNLKASPSFGGSFIPANAKHEARERDYFFMLAWICWGLWAGFGAVRLMRAATARRAKWTPAFLTTGALAAFLPLALNYDAVTREQGAGRVRSASCSQTNSSSSAAARYLLAHGDNEIYPVWYLQEVERERRDATVIVVPLLPAEWYRAEIARRQGLIPALSAKQWPGTNAFLSTICHNAARQHRIVLDATSAPDSNFPAACRNH